MTALLWIDGDSTLHRWHVDAHVVDVRMEVASEAPVRLASLDVTVPVASLASGEAAMDANLRAAMHADRFPVVRFHMTSNEPFADGLLVHGDLTVDGVTRPIDLDVSVTRTSGGLRFAGHEPIHLRDYGVEPPVFLGMLKTAEDVDVGFEVGM